MLVHLVQHGLVHGAKEHPVETLVGIAGATAAGFLGFTALPAILVGGTCALVAKGISDAVKKDNKEPD